MELAIKENEKKDLPVKNLIPENLHNFLDVFDNNKANWFPKSDVWDHKIDMKEGFKPKSFKNYNLTPEEQKELDKFLDKNLEKGYIWPFQLPQALPFFFVKKKDRRLWPCQDYQYLNWTVINIYSLSLILEIMDKLKGAKYFSKFDVQWGYNNVWIQSGDEWKATFKMNWGLYDPLSCSSECVILQQPSKLWWTSIQKGNRRGLDHCLYGWHSGIFQNNQWPQENQTNNTEKSMGIWPIFQGQEMQI
jgi:hypothetical protein